MRAKDLRMQVFGDFVEWLARNKVVEKNKLTGLDGDPFSMDVWMSKVFDVLYNQYEQEKQREKIRQNNLTIFSSRELMEMSQLRAAAEAQRDKAMKDAEAKKSGPVPAGKDDVPEDERPDNVKEFPKKETEETEN